VDLETFNSNDFLTLAAAKKQAPPSLAKTNQVIQKLNKLYHKKRKDLEDNFASF